MIKLISRAALVIGLLVGVYLDNKYCLMGALVLMFAVAEYREFLTARCVLDLVDTDAEIINSLRDHEHGLDGSAVMITKIYRAAGIDCSCAKPEYCSEFVQRGCKLERA